MNLNVNGHHLSKTPDAAGPSVMQPLPSTAPSSVLSTTLSQQGLFGMGCPALVARVLITILSSGCDLGSLKRRSRVPVTLDIWLYLLESPPSLRPNNISPLLQNIATHLQRCRNQPERSWRCRRKISP